MKILKKVLMGTVATLTLATVVACGESSVVDEVISKVILTQDGDKVSADFTVPKFVKYQGTKYDVTWTSSDTSVLNVIENDENTFTADVHRPFNTNSDVKLTASVTANNKTASTEFKTTVESISFETAAKSIVSNLGIKSVYTENSTLDLISSNKEYKDEVSLTYALDEGEHTNIKLENNKLVVTPADTIETAKVTVTVKSGSNEYTETLDVKATTAIFGEGVPYVFSLVQKNKDNKVLYFNGGMSGYYADTTEDATKAKPIYFEKVSGGYNVYFFNAENNKKYINIVLSGTYKNIKFEDTASSVWNLNGVYNTLVTTLADVEYFLGTYSTYTTISPSSIDKAETSFPASPSLGTDLDYTLSVVQKNKDNKVLYFNGEMSGYYGSTSTDVKNAKNVKLEATTGGYHLYFLNGDIKQYINLVVSGTYTNIKYQDEASSVYNVNNLYGTLTTVVNEKEYVIGANGSYETLGFYEVSNIDLDLADKKVVFPMILNVAEATTEVVEPLESAVKVAPTFAKGSITVDGSQANGYNADTIPNGHTIAEDLGLTNSHLSISFAIGSVQNTNGSPATGIYYDSIRLYYSKNDGNGNSLTITADSGYVIEKIQVELGDKGTLADFAIYGADGITAITAADNTWTINGDAFTLKNISTSTQVRIKSISVVVKAA